MKKLSVTYRATIDRQVKITVRTRSPRKAESKVMSLVRWRIPA